MIEGNNHNPAPKTTQILAKTIIVHHRQVLASRLYARWLVKSSRGICAETELLIIIEPIDIEPLNQTNETNARYRTIDRTVFKCPRRRCYKGTSVSQELKTSENASSILHIHVYSMEKCGTDGQLTEARQQTERRISKQSGG